MNMAELGGKFDALWNDFKHFARNDSYTIRISREDEITDEQWKSFCKRMDDNNLEDGTLWQNVDEAMSEVTETDE